MLVALFVACVPSQPTSVSGCVHLDYWADDTKLMAMADAAAERWSRHGYTGGRASAPGEGQIQVHWTSDARGANVGRTDMYAAKCEIYIEPGWGQTLVDHEWGHAVGYDHTWAGVMGPYIEISLLTDMGD